MVEKINIVQYRKLKNLVLSFDTKLNAISGTNGTCKTSLLHLIGNSFKAPNIKCEWIKDSKCISVIQAVNSVTNPKVESLTRGDQEYNDPAHGIKGQLFTVDYYGAESLSFRRHNSTQITRYALKPQYKTGTKDMLPYCPVIYLGLSRLVPFGEFQNDEALSNIKKKLPQEYLDEIARIYKKFTNYDISYNTTKKMGDIKVRSEFSSNMEGIDSNTISAGEDNLSIILTALISLKYYYNSIESGRRVESVLLIDELDATLHPAFQIKLLDLFREMAEAYKIQIVFTTHSLSLIEEMLSKKDNVIYLLDNVTSVVLMEEPDIYKIKMHLQSLTHEDIYADKVIPLFTEDAEARFLLDILFNYFSNESESFSKASRFFHMVKTNIGANNLIGIFKDSKLLRTTIRSICILDGDQQSDISNCIVALPGKKSPEQLLLDYAEQLYNDDDPFWTQRIIIDKGYSKTYYTNRIQLPVKDFMEKLRQKRAGEESTKGETREFNKKMFIENKNFFELLFKHWIHDPTNKEEVDRFFTELHKLFMKVAHYNEINPKEWE